ncbi:MAG: hypothetical protein GY772_23870 [bacterium]|nr:hypothetical protein [bacterium]
MHFDFYLETGFDLHFDLHVVAFKHACTEALSFAEIGGYDEESEIAPSGYQDVDIMDRMCAASGETMKAKHPRQAVTWYGTDKDCGVVLPNMIGVRAGTDKAARQQERGEAKIRNTSAEAICSC